MVSPMFFSLIQTDGKCFWLLFYSTHSDELNYSFQIHCILYSVAASFQQNAVLFHQRLTQWDEVIIGLGDLYI